ncbi:MAG: hypothetical protein V3U90_02610 [Dehalococcoidia bacterium]
MVERAGYLKEKSLYQPVKTELEAIIKAKFPEFHLEITAKKSFSNELKSHIPQGRDIIFLFLKEASPDITGFIKQQNGVDFLIAEIKAEKIKLNDIYQTKKYAELFDARYALLVSTKEIPVEIKRLSKVVYSMLSLPAYKTLTIANFDSHRGFVEWFPENPFLKGQ